jgi:hypothetical protein
LVEHDLAKVGVAGSSPVFRSNIQTYEFGFFLLLTFLKLGLCHPGGGIGRHAGLKILWSVRAVTVQLRSWVLFFNDLHKAPTLEPSSFFEICKQFANKVASTNFL